MPQTIPYKSVATALVFSIFLGPVGLLYSSFWGGLIMCLIGLIIVGSGVWYPLFFIWLICCIWSVAAVESYNRQLLNTFKEKAA